jgi:peptidoglycan/xylan/chitin deacetylase (PgdA/CDA1 family)
VLAGVALPCAAIAEKVALTFDDLPLNGELAPGMTRAGIVRDVLDILKSRRAPPVYGFINAQRMEGSADAAEAMRLWVKGGQLVGNHVYSHPDLSRTPAEEFLADARRNEPVLQLLDPEDRWHWFRYPYLHEGDTLAKRRQVRQGLAGAGRPRLPHRAGDAGLRGLPVEHALCALHGAGRPAGR